jgi:hypothetical protein
MSDAIRQAINEVRHDAEVQAEELKSHPAMAEMIRLHKGLNTLEDLCGDPLTPLSSLLGLGDSQIVSSPASLVSVGEFYGLEPLDAAKRYLRKRNKPATFDEIVAAIETGSCEVSNKATLKVSLGRSTFEIAKLSEDSFGLLEWYPHVKRSSARKQQRGAAAASNGSEPATAQPEPAEPVNESDEAAGDTQA